MACHAVHARDRSGIIDAWHGWIRSSSAMIHGGQPALAVTILYKGLFSTQARWLLLWIDGLYYYFHLSNVVQRVNTSAAKYYCMLCWDGGLVLRSIDTKLARLCCCRPHRMHAPLASLGIYTARPLGTVRGSRRDPSVHMHTYIGHWATRPEPPTRAPPRGGRSTYALLRLACVPACCRWMELHRVVRWMGRHAGEHAWGQRGFASLS
jgi:hypothetical protein